MRPHLHCQCHLVTGKPCPRPSDLIRCQVLWTPPALRDPSKARAWQVVRVTRDCAARIVRDFSTGPEAPWFRF